MSGAEWDTARGATLACDAYRYIAKVYPPDASLQVLRRADRAVLDAQKTGDWPGYVEALREVMRTAKRTAKR